MINGAGSYDNELPHSIKQACLECVLRYREKCMGLITIDEYWQYAGMEGKPNGKADSIDERE